MFAAGARPGRRSRATGTVGASYASARPSDTAGAGTGGAPLPAAAPAPAAAGAASRSGHVVARFRRLFRVHVPHVHETAHVARRQLTRHMRIPRKALDRAAVAGQRQQRVRAAGRQAHLASAAAAAAGGAPRVPHFDAAIVAGACEQVGAQAVRRAVLHAAWAKPVPALCRRDRIDRLRVRVWRAAWPVRRPRQLRPQRAQVSRVPHRHASVVAGRRKAVGRQPRGVVHDMALIASSPYQGLGFSAGMAAVRTSAGLGFSAGMAAVRTTGCKSHF
eukprot:364692-Chlamydomonas_euryale.AAC.14